MLFERIYEPKDLKDYPEKSHRKAVRAVIMNGDRLLMLKTVHGDYKFPGGGSMRVREVKKL